VLPASSVPFNVTPFNVEPPPCTIREAPLVVTTVAACKVPPERVRVLLA